MGEARAGSDVSILDSPSAPPRRDTDVGGIAAGFNGGGRILWLDCARGIGIILVVIGHAAGGMIDMRGGQPAAWLIYLFFAIYTFHMHLFFFLCAPLIERRVARDKAGFARSLGERIVYPYFLWSLIQLTLIVLADNLVNSPIDEYWTKMIALLWAPISQFWFLYVLAILQLLSLLLLPFLNRAAFLVAMVAIWLLSWRAPMAGPPGLVAQYALFYGLGVAMGPQAGAAIAALKPWRKIALVAAFGAALLVACHIWVEPALQAGRPHAAAIAYFAWRPVLLPVALLGGLTVLIFASTAGGRLAYWLSLLGKASMAIYLTHVILIAGSRILIGRMFWPIDEAILLPVLTAIGIGGPLAVQAVAKRFNVARLLALQ